jgi:hypothetical protein
MPEQKTVRIFQLPDILDVVEREGKESQYACRVAEKADKANSLAQRWRNSTIDLQDFRDRIDYFSKDNETNSSAPIKLKTIPAHCSFQLKVVLDEQISRRKVTPLK